MKEFLSRKHVAFEVKDVHTDAAAQEEMMEMGFAAIPVTVVGDAPPILGADFDEIDAALAGHG